MQTKCSNTELHSQPVVSPALHMTNSIAKSQGSEEPFTMLDIPSELYMQQSLSPNRH